MKRIMISAMQSGGGKTTLTCALLALLKKRGTAAEAFKCGPDYIDPMFHSRVLGVPSRNLDLFLQGETGVLKTLGGARGEIAVIEGAMGLYDGIGGADTASAYALAALTKTPVILAVMPRGSSLTLAAQIKGVSQFRRDSHVSGIVLTNCRTMLYEHLKPIIENETGLKVFGCLPPMPELEIPSRHLGLLTAGEIENLTARFDAATEALSRFVDVEALLALASTSEILPAPDTKPAAVRAKIALARDEAFCFYYEDSLDALRAAGAELVEFSPLRDERLPDCDGLYLGGGYPELYAKRLSENASMRQSVAAAVRAGMPTVAECGGFLYLGAALESDSGAAYPMAGVLPGVGQKTERLQNFGYTELKAERDSLLFRAGESVHAHEFHYWKSTENGADLTAVKPVSGRERHCGYVNESLYAAFPHLHFGGEAPLAARFVAAAERYKNGKA